MSSYDKQNLSKLFYLICCLFCFELEADWNLLTLGCSSLDDRNFATRLLRVSMHLLRRLLTRAGLGAHAAPENRE